MNLIYVYSGILFAIVIGAYFYYRSINSNNKPLVDALYTEALNSMVSGDTNSAIGILKRIVKQDSNHVRAYLQLGNILRNDNPEQAIKIHQSLTVRPNLSSKMQVDIHSALADDYRLLSNNSKAKEEAKLILGIEKRNLWALNFLINISIENQNWEEAFKWTKQLQKITGKKAANDEARFDVYKGLDCLEDGNIETARSLFKKAIKMNPEFPLSYRYLGDVFEQTRDLVKALENWEKFALKDLNGGTAVYTKIESALFDLGRFSEVEKFYRKILQHNPSNFEATIRLANVLEEKGESAAALTLIESASSNEENDIRIDLMKLKLSLITSTPAELAHKIDYMIEKLLKVDVT